MHETRINYGASEDQTYGNPFKVLKIIKKTVKVQLCACKVKVQIRWQQEIAQIGK